jgi:GNAT superfamily N-acetyltransferase
VTIDRAIETFVLGFSFSRSLTHPYLAEQIEGVWVTRDADRKRDDYRNEEWVAHGVLLEKLDAIARKHTRGHYMINVIRVTDKPDGPIREQFKTLGYRLTTTEALIVHSLAQIEPVDCGFPIVRVESDAEIERLNRGERRRIITASQVQGDAPPVRQYMAVANDRAVGWGASIAAGETRWCSNVFVRPEHRRKGIARAIMTRLLEDDRDFGAAANVLLASHAGAKLYPTVGYEQIGELMMYMPRRR